MNIILENNWLITTKNVKGELPLFCGDVERLFPIYGMYHRDVIKVSIKANWRFY